MNTPKRKVTDLLPSEAILISSDEDLKVLEEFEKAGIRWGDGKLATKFNPLEFTQRTSICVFYHSGSLWFSVPNNYKFTVPATDFIPTEAEKVEHHTLIEQIKSLRAERDGGVGA